MSLGNTLISDGSKLSISEKGYQEILGKIIEKSTPELTVSVTGIKQLKIISNLKIGFRKLFEEKYFKIIRDTFFDPKEIILRILKTKKDLFNNDEGTEEEYSKIIELVLKEMFIFHAKILTASNVEQEKEHIENNIEKLLTGIQTKLFSEASSGDLNDMYKKIMDSLKFIQLGLSLLKRGTRKMETKFGGIDFEFAKKMMLLSKNKRHLQNLDVFFNTDDKGYYMIDDVTADEELSYYIKLKNINDGTEAYIQNMKDTKFNRVIGETKDIEEIKKDVRYTIITDDSINNQVSFEKNEQGKDDLVYKSGKAIGVVNSEGDFIYFREGSEDPHAAGRRRALFIKETFLNDINGVKKNILEKLRTKIKEDQPQVAVVLKSDYNQSVEEYIMEKVKEFENPTTFLTGDDRLKAQKLKIDGNVATPAQFYEAKVLFPNETYNYLESYKDFIKGEDYDAWKFFGKQHTKEDFETFKKTSEYKIYEILKQSDVGDQLKKENFKSFKESEGSHFFEMSVEDLEEEKTQTQTQEIVKAYKKYVTDNILGEIKDLLSEDEKARKSDFVDKYFYRNHIFPKFESWKEAVKKEQKKEQEKEQQEREQQAIEQQAREQHERLRQQQEQQETENMEKEEKQEQQRRQLGRLLKRITLKQRFDQLRELLDLLHGGTFKRKPKTTPQSRKVNNKSMTKKTHRRFLKRY